MVSRYIYTMKAHPTLHCSAFVFAAPTQFSWSWSSFSSRSLRHLCYLGVWGGGMLALAYCTAFVGTSLQAIFELFTRWAEYSMCFACFIHLLQRVSHFIRCTHAMLGGCLHGWGHSNDILRYIPPVGDCLCKTGNPSKQYKKRFRHTCSYVAEETYGSDC